MTRQWKCTVCGYLHDGLEPPENCPRCGAERSQFIPMEAEKLNLLHDLWQTLVVHAVAAHFSSGLVPAAVLFYLLGLFSANPHFEPAAYYLLYVVLAAIPVSIVSGICDWRRKFKGTQALIFYKKMALAFVMFLLGLAAVSLHRSYPDFAAAGILVRSLYGTLLFGMLGCVTLLGHYGGKLVFKWKNRQL
jgi:rubredoxin/uncharacterized membrane protein YiaA